MIMQWMKIGLTSGLKILNLHYNDERFDKKKTWITNYFDFVILLN